VNEAVLKRALDTAYRYLARTPRSRTEVENRLRGKTFPEPVIHKVIQQLLDYRYLDDPAFARQWARDRIARHRWGPSRLRMELKRKGIAGDRIEAVVRELLEEQDEVSRAADLMGRRLGGRRISEPREYRRSYAYLLRRGYSSDAIETVLRNFSKQLENS
jgi:regulatory protein